ncbi:hypothetical protein Btru_018127 [Bulinus truncatus]|nr:hypothetical protein Btru_018127 [Bulinus truncatus]
MFLVLKQDPSQITLESLIKLMLFAKISKTECLDVVINGMLSLPPESFENIDIEKSNLTLDMALDMNEAPWLCPLLKKLANCCSKALSSDEPLPLDDVVKLGLSSFKIPFNDDGRAEEKLSQCIGELDSFFFIEFLKHYQYVQPFKKRLAKAFHDRLVKYLQDLELYKSTTIHYVWEQDGQIEKLIYRFYLKFLDSEIIIDKGIQSFVYKIKEFNYTEWCWPKFKVRLTVKNAVEKLQSNNSLSPAELTSVIKILRVLDLDDLMLLNRNVEEISFSKISSKAVKFQSLQIRKTVLEIFYDRLNHTSQLIPTLTTRTALPPSLIYETRLGLLEPLLSSLPRFTADKAEINCVRTLRILELTVEKFPIYQMETFENILFFLKSRRETSIYCSFQFTKAVSYAGYIPQDSSFFFTSSKQLAEEILKTDLLEKRLQVELAYSLSLLGIFFDDLVNRIFSLDFLSDLDEELEDLSFKGAERIKKILSSLSLNVALECPHLSVKKCDFSSNCKMSKIGGDMHPVVEKICNSLSRICGDSSWIQTKCFSSYGHSIDALLYVQNRQSILKPEEGQLKLKAGEDIDRLAVLYLGKNQFCVNSDQMKGQMTTKIRQLEMLGYIVVLVPYSNLSSMELHRSRESRYISAA